MIGIIGIGLRMLVQLSFQRAIRHVHFARLAVQFKEDRPQAVFAGFAGGEVLDDQPLARLDLDGNFFAALKSVEKGRRGNYAGVVVACTCFS